MTGHIKSFYNVKRRKHLHFIKCQVYIYPVYLILKYSIFYLIAFIVYQIYNFYTNACFKQILHKNALYLIPVTNSHFYNKCKNISHSKENAIQT